MTAAEPSVDWETLRPSSEQQQQQQRRKPRGGEEESCCLGEWKLPRQSLIDGQLTELIEDWL